MSYSWRRQQWPLKPASPKEVVEGTIDDINDMSRFMLQLMGHRNPAVMYGTVAVSQYALGYGATFLAGGGTRMAHWAGRAALTNFLRGTVGIAGTAVGRYFYGGAAAYYIGRNISHAIDPQRGEERFHHFIFNPGEMGYNLSLSLSHIYHHYKK